MEQNKAPALHETPLPMPLNERHRIKSLCVIALLFAGVLWLIVVQINAFTRQNGAPPEGWSWSSMAVLDIAFIYGLMRAVANYYRDSHTIITGEGITQKTLSGTRVLRWADVNEFTMIGYTLHLPRPGGRLSVNTGAYMESSEALVDRILSYTGKASGEDETDEDAEDFDEYSSPPPDTKVI